MKWLVDYVERAKGVGSRVCWNISLGDKNLSRDEKTAKAFLSVDKETGDLQKVVLWTDSIRNLFLTVYTSGGFRFWNTSGGMDLRMGEDIFENSHLPTFEELDLFEVLYGDEQQLIDAGVFFNSFLKSADREIRRGNYSISKDDMTHGL